MRLILYALFGIGLLFPSLALSRPVSYPDGWTFMTMNDADQNNVHIHYSPTARYSLGYKLEYWRNKEITLNAIQVNNLLKRWNQPDSQANLYLKSGIGVAYTDAGDFDEDIRAAAFTGVSADWEDRRYFLSYENRYTQLGNIDDFFQQSARVGWAPYEGDYGDLHTWLMVQVDHMPEADDTITVTPLIRLFKNVHLLEAGISNQGDFKLNYILRY